MCFTLSKKEKEEFVSLLASIKVSDGYASTSKDALLLVKFIA